LAIFRFAIFRFAIFRLLTRAAAVFVADGSAFSGAFGVILFSAMTLSSFCPEGRLLDVGIMSAPNP
jgi:hypothetical protein